MFLIWVGFEPNFELTEKMDINGKNEDALWTWLKQSIPIPYDDKPLEGSRAGKGSSADFYGDNQSKVLWGSYRVLLLSIL